MFTNPSVYSFIAVFQPLLTFPLASVFSTFFRLGQTLETFRGQGIYQPSIDIAIAKLNQGDWV
jgi:monolysocardiolipin acyltransferase